MSSQADVSQLLSAEYLQHIMLDFQQMAEFVENPLVIRRADGIWYEDVYGKRYIDAHSGAYVVAVGHNNKRIQAAMAEQLAQVAFTPPPFATNLPAIELANKVVEVTPDDLNTVKFLLSGSDATEAAMKMARQYHNQTGNPKKYKILSFYWGYHGATFGAVSASGITRRRRMFEPLMPGMIHLWPHYCYRCPFTLTYPDCQLRCASIIEDTIVMEGPETVAAIITEPIGNTGGLLTPPPEYLPMLRDICTRHNILLIFDEVLTGFGRTGQMFAAQTFATTPDILCMGKGMASGYAPLSGIAIREPVARAFWGEPGMEFAHGVTFGANPVACAAGLANLAEIQERDLVRQGRERGAYLWQQLEDVGEELGIIGEIRGKGLLIAVEFVQDPATKKRFGEDVRFGRQVGKQMWANGLLTRFDTHWLAFAPPLIISEAEVDQMVEIFRASLKQVLARL
jgi:adenosylmethionine-8-amino-7-oxononanoate aminotransferase